MKFTIPNYEKDETGEAYLMQRSLKVLGFYQGALDNDFGPKSQAALDAYKLAISQSNAEQQLAQDTGIHWRLSAGTGRQISTEGLELVKHFEGFYANAYRDEVGVWTIGWGHTGLTHKDGTVKQGRTVTREEGEDLLRHDMQAFAARVEKLATVPLSDDEFAALTSFDFNTGGLEKSTLLKKLNAGDREGAADEFLRWDKAGGRRLPGLTRRRKSERNLFLGVRPFIVPHSNLPVTF